LDDPFESVLTERFQRRATIWLRAFSVVCVTTALFAPLMGEAGFRFAKDLPFFHCPLFWAALFIRSLPNPWMGRSSVYVRDNYPHIWKKLRPWGDNSYNSIAGFAFVFGKYDDGNDPHLQLIKKRSLRGVKLMAWPFALIPVCWFTASFIYFNFVLGSPS